MCAVPVHSKGIGTMGTKGAARGLAPAVIVNQ